MTSFETLSLVISIAGSLGIIISLWFVYLQTRLFAKQTEYVARSLSVSISQSINSHVEDITRIFIQFPEMRPYFYQSKPIDDTHADYSRAEAIAELILDTLFSVFAEVTRGMRISNKAQGDPNWQAYVRDCFAQSPILVKFLQEHRGWYNDELWTLMLEGVKQRDPQST